MEIIVKPDGNENSRELYDLLRNGLGGRYVLKSSNKDKDTGAITFRFKEKAAVK